ncbi:hypothetical protein BJY52DRAFT_1224008 [Lactarius psammicola]|nr:hypothetical protein BJY52DRAFT_1224008 [Lactarius psammicola]
MRSVESHEKDQVNIFWTKSLCEGVDMKKWTRGWKRAKGRLRNGPGVLAESETYRQGRRLVRWADRASSTSGRRIRLRRLRNISTSRSDRFQTTRTSQQATTTDWNRKPDRKPQVPHAATSSHPELHLQEIPTGLLYPTKIDGERAEIEMLLDNDEKRKPIPPKQYLTYYPSSKDHIRSRVKGRIIRSEQLAGQVEANPTLLLAGLSS